MDMSKNWLTIFSEGKTPVPAKKQELAARQDEFARKVENLRKASGKLETRRMRFVCACTSGEFVAEFERMNPKDKFRIARIEKEQAATPAAVLFASALGREEVLDHEQFDTSGWYCAHCNVRGGFVYCEWCGANVCKGRTKRLPNGKEDYHCRDGCAATGELSPYRKMHAEENPSGLFAKFGIQPVNIGALPARPSAPALPNNNTPRLGGPRR
jgi:hypothetical protein